MQISITDLTVLLGTLFLLIGIVYRYKLKHFSLFVGDGLLLIVLSYAASAGIVYMVGSIDFVFFNASLLGFTYEEIKVPVLIGALAGIWVAYYFFRDFMRRETNHKSSKKL